MISAKKKTEKKQGPGDKVTHECNQCVRVFKYKLSISAGNGKDICEEESWMFMYKPSFRKSGKNTISGHHYDFEVTTVWYDIAVVTL